MVTATVWPAFWLPEPVGDSTVDVYYTDSMYADRPTVLQSSLVGTLLSIGARPDL